MTDLREMFKGVELPFRGASEPSISEPEQKQVLKSLLDKFLETTADDNETVQNDNSGRMTLKLLEEVEAFIAQVAKCYQAYGCPTHTTEVNIVRVAKGLGIESNVLVFPTMIFVQIENIKTDKGLQKRHSQFFRTSSGYNFYKLQLVDELVRRISSYAQDATEAAQANEVRPSTVDKAFARARAYSNSVASGATGPPIPMEEIIATDDHLPEIYDGHLTSHQIRPDDSPFGVMAEDVEVEAALSSIPEEREVEAGPSPPPEPSPLRGVTPIEPYTPRSSFHMLLPYLPRLPKFPVYENGNERRQAAKKLANMILSLARIGPNVYTVHEADSADTESGRTSRESTRLGRKYRNLFSRLAVEDGVHLIKAIINQKPLYSIGFKVFLTGLSSFGSCGIFFGGGWVDCAFSFVLGVMIALIELISLYSPTFARIYEFVATFMTSIVIRAVSAHYHHICYRAVLLSTIVFVLQGATITLAFVDIMTKDLITGSTKVFFGMLISALIGFAMDISTSSYAAITERDYGSVVEDSVCENPIETHWYPLMFLVMCLGFNILLEAHYHQLLPMTVITACGYLVYYYLAQVISNQVPTILSAFTSSCLSNLYSRRTGQPAVVYIIPAIFLLVPGSVAASSFYTVLTLDLRGGLNLTFAVVTGALSVAIGIFAASAVFPVPDVEEFFRKSTEAYPAPHTKKDSLIGRRAVNFNSGLAF